MTFFADLFTEPIKPVVYNGKKVYPAEFIEGPQKFKAIVKIVSTNSTYRQGFSFNMSGMKGKLTYGGEVVLSNRISFWADTVPHQFEVDVEIDEGLLLINNFCDNTGTGSCVSGCSGFAMLIEEIAENKNRYYCNDIVPDDDFEDLIFEVEFVK